MRSPASSSGVLERLELEPGLTAFRCSVTGGVWIDGDAYHRWVESHPRTPHTIAASDAQQSLLDSRHALISPRSGRLLTKYRVGHGEGFVIDFDAATGGFWLDSGEYDRLKSLGLHDELHLITGDRYQAQLRRQETEQTRQRRFKALLGADYVRVDEFRVWVETHPHRQVILACLCEQM